MCTTVRPSNKLLPGDDSGSFIAFCLGTKSKMLSSRIPPGEPSTVGLGPPAILSCMVLHNTRQTRCMIAHGVRVFVGILQFRFQSILFMHCRCNLCAGAFMTRIGEGLCDWRSGT